MKMSNAIAIGMLLLGAGVAPVAAQHGESEERRTGNPFGISWLARPTNSPAYFGYLVGGGSARRHKAEAPTLEEGTWGWDYSGWLFHRRVNSGWWHGRRDQNGTYRTDGPHILHPLEEGGH